VHFVAANQIDTAMKYGFHHTCTGRYCRLHHGKQECRWKTRDYVDYEITASHKKINGMLGIYIHNLKDMDKTDTTGSNPFDKWTFKNSEGSIVKYPTYDWVNDDGYKNMSNWIEVAAQKAGR
jgi:hypothetical protein